MKDGPSDAENGLPSPQLSRKEKRKLSRTGSEELVKEGNAGKGREGRAFLSRRVLTLVVSVRLFVYSLLSWPLLQNESTVWSVFFHIYFHRRH